ncbi:MAG: class B sortase [Lachnospiraceae bacterium]|nr:class B sortase [Lachnospiraceae bacterium]
MANMEVGGRVFRDIESYKAARRDFDSIEDIKERHDLTRIEDVERIRDNIINGNYRFETMLGDDFLDELDELLETLKKDKALSQNERKGFKLFNKEEKTKDVKEQIREKKNISHDEELEAEIKRQIKIKERKRKIMVALLSVVALACIGYLIFYYTMYAKNDAEYSDLSELIDDTVTSKEYSVNIVHEDKTIPPVLKKYEKLYQKNKKLVGWLKIEGTNIDYPVMQTVNNEYYLDHNYNQEYDKNGSIFMDKDCDAAHPNDNMIIYGHHMKSGKMFGNLNLYSKEEYYKEHPSIMFDTIYEEGTYDIMYVFRSRIYSEEEIVFKYYKFIDATSEDEFNSNMDEMAAISLYDTGVTAHYGDKLITLSTCDYNEANGRFVVVAKKVK